MRQTIIRLFLVTIFMLILGLSLRYNVADAAILALVATYVFEGAISEKLK